MGESVAQMMVEPIGEPNIQGIIYIYRLSLIIHKCGSDCSSNVWTNGGNQSSKHFLKVN